MLARSWFDALKSRLTRTLNRRQRRASGRRGPAVRRLRLEPLEDRRLLAFDLAVSYPSGTNPQAVLTADFNGDGKLDVAVANYNTSTVSVLLGNGGGTFQPAVTSATGYLPLSLAVGDFNADGKLDLATANAYDVSVLLGNKDGTFNPPSSYGVVGNPQSVAVGDFNGDSTLDLGVTSNYYTPGYYGGYNNEAYANVLVGNADALGNADGTFSGPNATFIDPYFSANTALAADLNGDIYDDFVTFDSYGYVTPLLGDSSGYLQGPTDYFYTGDNSYAVAAEDLDGNGTTDLVTANFYGNSVGVLLGDGTGSFSGPVNYDAGGSPISIVLGDFTGDGNLDVATANYYSDQVSVLHGGGDGTFSTPVLSAVGSYPRAVAAGDFNGDGWLDAATANSGAADVSVLINDQSWPPPPPPPPPPASLSIGDVTVTEGDGVTVAAEFTVTRSVNLGGTVTVNYSTADGDALAGSDYVAQSGTLTFADGVATMPVTILVNGDLTNEYDEIFYVNLNAATGANITDSQGVGTILDNDPPASLSIGDVTVTEGDSGTVAAVFTVTRGASLGGNVTVNYSTSNGDALAGSDYVFTSGTLTFGPGVTELTITVPVIGDLTNETDQIFYVNLNAATGANITDSQGVGTILDNDPPPASLSIGDKTVTEGDGGTVAAVFTVTRSASLGGTVTVNYSTANGGALAGSDYVFTSGTLTFGPGVTELTITVPVNGDLTDEYDQAFYVNLSAATGANIIDSQGVGTILDNDPPPTITITANVSAKEGHNNKTTSFDFFVTLSAASEKEVRVNFATADGTATTADNDYVANSGTLVFAPGQTSQTISVVVKGDKKKESNETFFVNLSGATNATIAAAQGIGEIRDDDTPPPGK